MKTKIIICLAALLGLAAADIAKKQIELPIARLTVKVIDEQGQAVSEANVNLVFQDPITRKGAPVDGRTDVAGIFSAEGGSNSRVGGNVQKEGYYRAGFAFKDFIEVKDGRWLPWDATYKSILRPIVKPVPLCARVLNKLQIPTLSEPCGYDLVISDWVAPWGKGKTSDLVIKVDERRYTAWGDFDVAVSVTFSNPQDGLKEVELPEYGRYSTFKWERFAPEEGYTPTFNTRTSSHPVNGYKSTSSAQQNFFFRVRTAYLNGKLVGGLYGKISGGIIADVRNSDTAVLSFTYYLNPTSLDRNLEWDKTKNLISGLRDEENPRAP